MTRSTLALILTGILLNATAQLCLKLAADRNGYVELQTSALWSAAGQLAHQPAFWLGLSCYAISVAVWLVVLSRVDVSLAYPLVSLGYVINAVGAWFLLGEALSAQRLAGIGVIMLGVYILGRS
jgi:multidrug transporter EmrE-like cation transporter